VGIGGGIFLIALGAVMTFAFEVEPWWLDLDVVGAVLMLAGATVLAVTLWFWRRRRPSVAIVPPTAQESRLPTPPDPIANRPAPPEPPLPPPPPPAA
jgi:hypothetical protein